MATFNPLTGLMEPSSTGEGSGLELGYSPSLSNNQLGMNWNTPTIAADPSDSYVSGYEPAGYTDPNYGGWSSWDTASGAAPTMKDFNQIYMNDMRNVFSDGIQSEDFGAMRNIFSEWGSNAVDMAKNTGAGKAVRGATDASGEVWGELSAPEKFNTVWGGLQSLGKMYGTYKGFQMAKDQMGLQKDMWNKTWDANKKQFNEAVSTRADSRYNTVDNRDKRQSHKDQYSI